MTPILLLTSFIQVVVILSTAKHIAYIPNSISNEWIAMIGTQTVANVRRLIIITTDQPQSPRLKQYTIPWSTLDEKAIRLVVPADITATPLNEKYTTLSFSDMKYLAKQRQWISLDSCLVGLSIDGKHSIINVLNFTGKKLSHLKTDAFGNDDVTWITYVSNQPKQFFGLSNSGIARGNSTRKLTFYDKISINSTAFIAKSTQESRIPCVTMANSDASSSTITLQNQPCFKPFEYSITRGFATESRFYLFDYNSRLVYSFSKAAWDQKGSSLWTQHKWGDFFVQKANSTVNSTVRVNGSSKHMHSTTKTTTEKFFTTNVIIIIIAVAGVIFLLLAIIGCLSCKGNRKKSSSASLKVRKSRPKPSSKKRSGSSRQTRKQSRNDSKRSSKRKTSRLSKLKRRSSSKNCQQRKSSKKLGRISTRRLSKKSRK